MAEFDLFRVLLRPEGSVHFCFKNGCCHAATAESLVCCFSDPLRLLESIDDLCEETTKIINGRRQAMEKVPGLTLAQYSSNGKFVSHYPDLFAFALVSYAETEKRKPLNMRSYIMEHDATNSKNYLLRYFMEFTESFKKPKFGFKAMELDEDILFGALREMFNCVLALAPLKPEQKDLESVVNGCRQMGAFNVPVNGKPGDMVSVTVGSALAGIPHEETLRLINNNKLTTARRNESNEYDLSKNEIIAIKGSAGSSASSLDQIIANQTKAVGAVNSAGVGRKRGRPRKEDTAKAHSSGLSNGKGAVAQIEENCRSIERIKDALASQPPATEVERIIREEGIYSFEVARYIHNMPQYEYFKANGYIDIYHVDDLGVGRHVLIREIDPKLVTEDGLTNMERMRKGRCAQVAVERNGVPVLENMDLHHLAHRSSCYAVVPHQEHIGSGTTKIFHTGKPNEDVHDKAFGEFRIAFWMWMEEQYRKNKKVENFVRDNSVSQPVKK